ncbi:MAG: dihydroxy-acid dehydratase [Caldilineaceae bacterium]
MPVRPDRGVRYAGVISLEEAAEIGCRTCASPGGGCQFLGTAATSELSQALGMTLMHAALAPSGQPIWLDMAERSALALMHLEAAGKSTTDVLTEDALHNAMVVHAFGSTNLLLHIPAIAYAAGLPSRCKLAADQQPGAPSRRCTAQRPRCIQLCKSLWLAALRKPCSTCVN